MIRPTEFSQSGEALPEAETFAVTPKTRKVGHSPRVRGARNIPV